MSARQEISVRDNLISLVEACPPSGLEFIRTMNQKAVAIVIMTPTVASVVAWILWISIHIGLAKIRDKDFDVQVIVTTGFTIAIYLVTAGGCPKDHTILFDAKIVQVDSLSLWQGTSIRHMRSRKLQRGLKG
jgi:hypothetical protein